MKSFAKLVSAIALAASSAAQAHYLWIEPTETGARLYYGEAEAALREKSPGKLDNIKAPKAFVPDAANGKTSSAALTRADDHFSIAANRNAASILAHEESMEVRDLSKSGLGFAKSNYYARHGQTAANAEASPLALDLQTRGPNAYTVLYRGQPLKDAKLEVIAPNTWVQEHKTNAQGAVEINTPWRGRYVVHVLHVDKSAGEFAGKKYESLRNHFTYSFVKQDGADPGRAMPPQHVED
jgi:uncharacterized GH25 family protein